jgi:hypothetical protein
MEGLWIGIIFLMNTSLGGSLPFGLNDEYFKSEKECWKYFNKHPSFKIEREFSQNHYHIRAKIKKYKIKYIGIAFVTCKEKIINETTSPHDPKHIHRRLKNE